MKPLRGNAVQIISLVQAPGKTSRVMKLDTLVLREIISKAESHPIALISIAGPARKGKSFMLTYIVRHLLALETSKDCDPGDWLDKEHPDVPMKDNGFAFENGIDRTTEGIWMWSRPFIIKKSSDELALAVFVMDTEGCFDPYSTEKEQSGIAAISILLSSCFIYNDSGLINDSTLSTLANFLQYGQITSQSFTSKFFQRLMFLVRDWSTGGFEYGAAGGQGFIKKCLAASSHMTEEAVRIRKLIAETFEDYNAYLMPPPGNGVIAENFRGSIAEMSPDFRNHLELFVNNLVADVEPKRIAGQTASGDVYFRVFRAYVESFNHDDMPDPESILKVGIYHAMESRIHMLVAEYEKAMGKKIGKDGADPFPLQTTLERYHEKAVKATRKVYKDMRSLGTESDRQLFFQKLEHALDDCFKGLVRQNDNNIRTIMLSHQEEAFQQFKKQIELKFLSSSKIFEATEFHEQAGTFEAEVVQIFVAAVAKAPQEIVKEYVKTLNKTLHEEKYYFWNELEARKSKAEQQMLSLIQTCLYKYKTNMDVVLSMEGDEAVFPHKTLLAYHERQKQKLLVEFTEMTRNQFSDQDFVSKYIRNFIEELDKEFKVISSGNDEKLNTITKLMETDLVEAVEVFKEEGRDILALEMHPEQLIPLVQDKYSEILDMGYDTIGNRGHPDHVIMRNYRQLLTKNLKAAMEEIKSWVSSSTTVKQQQCDEVFRSAVIRYEQFAATYVKGKYLLEVSELEDQLTTEEERIRSELKMKVEQISADNAPSILRKLQEVINKENQKLKDFLSRKKEKFEQDAHARVKELVKLYEDKMGSTGHRWMSASDVGPIHFACVREIEHNFKSYPPFSAFPKYQEEFWKKLQTSMEESYLRINSRVQVEGDARQKFLSEFVAGLMADYKMKITHIIGSNPFMEEEELTSAMDSELEHIKDAIQGGYESNFPGIAFEKDQHAIESCGQAFDLANAELLETGKASREVAEQNLDQIIVNCESYIDQHELLTDVRSNYNSGYDLDTLFETLKNDTITHMEELWNFPPSTASAKSRLLQSVVERVQLSWKTVKTGLLAKAKEKEQIIQLISNSVITEMCSEVSRNLEQGRFYNAETLTPTFSQTKYEERDKFRHELQSKGIEYDQTVGQDLEARIDDKFQSLMAANEEAIQKAVREAKEACKQFYQDNLKDVRSQEALNLVRKTADYQMFHYVEARSVDELQEDSGVKVELITFSEDMYGDTLKALQTNPASDVARVLKEAVKIYNETMNKQLRGWSKGVHPENLLEFHNFSVKCVLKRIERLCFLTLALRDQTKERLQLTYDKFQDQNALLHGQDTNVAIGIDLGTTTSCVAIYRNGEATVIKDNGNALIPSYVNFDEHGSPIVGFEAKNQAALFPDTTIFDAKRLIGRQFNDPYVQNDILTWPFTVDADPETGRPIIVVRDLKFTPEGISAKVLSHMRRLAAKHLHHQVTKAVITVPANFTDAQREATRQAAIIAGLDVLQIINEPTAAALAYSLSWNDEPKTVLVYDFGGGTFDVTILRTEVGPVHDLGPGNEYPAAASSTSSSEVQASTLGSRRLRVLRTAGHTHLGGEDCDSKMVAHCVRRFHDERNIYLLELQEGNVNVQARNRLLRRLRNACERAKHVLTSSKNADVEVDEVYLGQNLEIRITQEEFNSMNEDLFQQTIDTVAGAMMDADVKPEEITDVLMVGGSSRIPRVRQMLQEFLGKRSLSINQRVDIQEAVAIGAAVQACILNGGATLENVPFIKDIQPFTLGIEVENGKMSPIIHRNTQIPCKVTSPYATSEDNQSEVVVRIYAGEDKIARNNIILGEFELTGIPPEPKGSQKLEVQMEIDVSGILHVTATIKSSGNSNSLTIKECRGYALTDM